MSAARMAWNLVVVMSTGAAVGMASHRLLGAWAPLILPAAWEVGRRWRW